MSKVFVDTGVSLDGYNAGPNAAPHNPLDDGGTRIHERIFNDQAWRESQGHAGGQADQDNQIVEESIARAGAYLMGRRMFDEGELGWSGPPPFRAPVFVLTSDLREPWVRQDGTTFYFVTDGIESAIDQSTEAPSRKDAWISGRANVVQQYLNAGLVDELQIHIAPVLLDSGTQLFNNLELDSVSLEQSRVIGSIEVTCLRYSDAKKAVTW